MWRELQTVFDEVAADRDVRAMVLTGAGGAFCSGADLSDPSDVAGRPGDPYLVQMRALADLALRLHRLPKPTIAKVGGIAAGAGMSMALGCDLVVASESARFSQIFAKRGLSIDFGASWLLPRLIGLHKAKELAFFADVLSASEAESFGLVNRVVPDDELDSCVDAWAAPPGRRTHPRPVDDQEPAQQLDGRVDGAGPGGRGPGPVGQLRNPGHPRGADRLRRTASARVRGPLSLRSHGGRGPPEGYGECPVPRRPPSTTDRDSGWPGWQRDPRSTRPLP